VLSCRNRPVIFDLGHFVPYFRTFSDFALLLCYFSLFCLSYLLDITRLYFFLLNKWCQYRILNIFRRRSMLISVDLSNKYSFKLHSNGLFVRYKSFIRKACAFRVHSTIYYVERVVRSLLQHISESQSSL
jgi:hypothetical protein